MPTAPPTLTAPGESPDRTDPSTFNARSIARDDWTKNTNVPEMVLALANVYANAVDAYNNATTAAGAALAAGAVVWVTGTEYVAGDARYSPIDFQTYRRKTDGAGATDPSLDAANWARVNLTPPSIVRSARTGNTILAEADRGTLLDYTSGTFDQTFPAAASLGDGFFCYLRNSGTGVPTLNPDGAELIDGIASYPVYSKEARLLYTDGAAWYTIVLHPFTLEPASTMTFVEPPGYRAYEVFLAAPGGGGGSGCRGVAGSSRGGGGGGGAGQTNWAILKASTPGASITLTVGANGTGGAAIAVDSTNGNNGVAGGTHSFGSLLSAVGGSAGVGGTGAAAAGGAGAAVGAGQVPTAGTAGGDGGNNATGTAGVAGTAWGATGGGGGGCVDSSNNGRNGAAGGASGTASSATQLAGGTAGETAGTRAGGDGVVSAAQRGGTGGGGGAGGTGAAAGANGGNGKRGGGGGGGSGAANGQLSGAGGNGEGYFYVGGMV